VVATTPIVQMHDISVTFPSVKALESVDFQLFGGEVHALMGQNGAGKSTLIKALTGVYDIDSGVITVDGTAQRFTTPRQAQDAGISTVYQEVNLCPNLTVGENILLGREPRRFGRIIYRALHDQAGTLLSQLELDVDPRSTLGSHPIAVQQLVAIARATAVSAKVLVLDEPTSSLDADEVSELFRVVRRLRDAGTAVLFVSHFLDQVYEIADRMTVLRNGNTVGEWMVADLDPHRLIAAMLGRELDVLDEIADEASELRVDTCAAPIVSVERIARTPRIKPTDLTFRAGEVVGLAGLLGSGRTELARLVFGADRATGGRILVDGVSTSIRSPRSAIAARFAFSSENRKGEGIVAELSVRDNLVLALQARRGFARPLSSRTKNELVTRYIEMLDIRPAEPDIAIKDLSGGNQQKVLLARWLITAPRLLILDEPTRGIDIGAKAQIQKLITELSADGMAVLFISAELDEVARISNRIAVLRDGLTVTEIDGGCAVSDLTELIATGNR
jgi:simple sugar transport system ATP-binding protein